MEWNGLEWNHGVEWSGVDFSGVRWSRWIDGMQCSGVQWNGVDGMQCSGVEWNGCTLVILALLVILGKLLAVVGQKLKKVNCLTRRRHISAAYLTS